MSNVALSVSLGLAVLTGDADAISITGDLFGAAGIAYFFYPRGIVGSAHERVRGATP